MRLPPSVTDWLSPDKTRVVRVACLPGRATSEISLRIAPSSDQEFNLGRYLEALQDVALADIQRQLEVHKYILDRLSSSRSKLVFRYEEEPRCLSPTGS